MRAKHSVLALALLVGCGKVSMNPEPTKCVMEIDSVMEGMQLTAKINDASLIKSLLLDPLERRVVEKSPARYRVFAEVTISFDDGSERSVMLFLPIGHLKEGDIYYVTDLEPLRIQLSGLFKQAKEGIFDKSF